MAKSKLRKSHKSKVNARNTAIKNEKNKMQKMQKEFIEQLIKREQDKGMFDNDQTVNTDIIGPTI
jgi:hypothetical protein